MAARLMPRIIMVRHGRATGGWDDDPDPGLDELGQQQAHAIAQRLSSGPPVAIVSSPLRRCRETAAPLAKTWSAHVAIETEVAEIPSPEGVPLNDRVGWLREACKGTWAALGPRYQSYRDDVAACLLLLGDDAVVFSHFIAINAAIGAATGDDRVVIHSLDNTSCTIFEHDGTMLRLVEAGAQAETLFR
jgi:broad specificity phosphatase PhoE